MYQALAKSNLSRFSILLFFTAVWLLLFLFQPPAEAQRDAATVAGIWTFDEGNANDNSNQKLHGTFVGKPKSVKGIANKALQFNGESDGIHIPDSPRINTNNTFRNRTVAAFFNCDDVSKNQKQVIFEEGGQTRGLAIYVFEGKLYVGGWNRAEYQWAGAWPSVKIQSNRWYHVGLVIRDAAGKVENDKFEMWLDGKLIRKEKGGQLHPHADNNGIGYLNQNSFYHDGGRAATNTDWFGGMIDDVVIYGSAFNQADFTELTQPLSVEPGAKFTTTWANMKTQRNSY